MIRTLGLLAVLVGSLAAQAQPADLRAALVFDYQADLRAAPDVAEETSTVRLDTAFVDPWLGRDKVLHAAGSFLMTLSAQYVLQAKLDASRNEALPVSAGVVLGLGLAKEVADSRRPVRPFFSTRDLVADAVGVALAVGLILL